MSEQDHKTWKQRPNVSQCIGNALALVSFFIPSPVLSFSRACTVSHECTAHVFVSCSRFEKSFNFWWKVYETWNKSLPLKIEFYFAGGRIQIPGTEAGSRPSELLESYFPLVWCNFRVRFSVQENPPNGRETDRPTGGTFNPRHEDEKSIVTLRHLYY